MPTVDLLAGIHITASAAIVVGTILLAGEAPVAALRRTALAFLGWFAVISTAGALGVFRPTAGLGTFAVGIAIVAPILVMAMRGLRSEAGMSRLQYLALPALIGVHVVRLLGYNFVLLYEAGRLPAPFAPAAGWGDVFIGITALPVAWMVLRQVSGWKPVAIVWSLLGAADLITAISLGITSAPDSPLRVFYGPVDTALMAELPWILIPGFMVPTLLSLHGLALLRLFRGEQHLRHANAAV